jgi:hypothetical protein
LEDLDTKVVINSAWNMIEKISTIQPNTSQGFYALKKHKPWLDERFLELLDQRKQAKLQWLQEPVEIDGDNMNGVRHDANRYFWNKKREYLKDKINEFAKNGNNKNIRDLYRGTRNLRGATNLEINYLFPIFISQFWSAFWSRDTNIHLVFSTFSSRSTSLLASIKVSVLLFTVSMLSPSRFISISQKLMCPIQFQSHTIFLDLLDDIF